MWTFETPGWITWYIKAYHKQIEPKITDWTDSCAAISIAQEELSNGMKMPFFFQHSNKISAPVMTKHHYLASCCGNRWYHVDHCFFVQSVM
jgi:hypothetical protein